MKDSSKSKAKKVLMGASIALNVVFSALFVSALAIGCSQSSSVQSTNSDSNVVSVQPHYRVDASSYYFKVPVVGDYVDNGNNVVSASLSFPRSLFYSYSDSIDGLFDGAQTARISMTENNGTDWFFYCMAEDWHDANFYSFETTIDEKVLIFVLQANAEDSWMVSENSNGAFYNFNYVPVPVADYSDLIPDVFEGASEAVTGFTSSLASGIQSMVSLFYDTANNRMTFLGMLSLIGVGVDIVYWVFRLIRGLIGRRLS